MIRREDFSIVFSISFLLYNFLWCYYPIIASILRGRSSIPYLTFDSFLLFSLLEIIPVTIIQLIILIINSRLFANNRPDSKIFDLGVFGEGIILLISFFLTVYFWSIVGVKGELTYLDVNSLQVTQAGSATYRIIGFVSIFKNLIFGYLYVMLLSSEKRTLKMYKVIALLILLLDAFLNLRIGSRVQILVPLVILIYYAAINHWTYKRYVPMAIIFIVFLTIGGAMAIIIGNQRTKSNFSMENIREEFIILTRYTKQEEYLALIFDQLTAKYDSISYGGVLIEAWGPGYAGFKPYIGSILSLVPRIIIPDKPVPGSINSSYLGTPQRLVPNRIGSYSSQAVNVGVSPVAISVWQNGYVAGIILFLVFNIIALLFLNFMFRSTSKIIQAIAFSTLNLPSAAYFVTSPDNIILTYQRIIIVYIISLIIINVMGRRQIKQFAGVSNV